MVSICIPTHNNFPALAACIEAIKQNTEGEYELLILEYSTPQGYVKTANRLLEIASGDPIIVLNEDALPQPGWLPPLVESAKHHHVSCPRRTEPGQFFAAFCTVWSREGIKELGGLDPRFIHWQSDVELLERTNVNEVAESYVWHSWHNPERSLIKQPHIVADWIVQDDLVMREMEREREQ